MQKVHLLVIDPQVDFCEKDGALFVPGAGEDIVRLATFVDRIRDKLEMIHVTLDCHHFIDIAHPIFWVDRYDDHNKNENHLVRGIDGKPTFDARHVVDAVRERLG